ncbi:MAG: hypothetical protein RR413_12410 [Christensenellaceae bacterium]
MKAFDWEKFKLGEIAVHCDTEVKANEFLKQAYELGFTWSGAESLLEENYYSSHENETCYRAWDDSCVKELTYQRMSYYQKNNYQIIEWSDYMEFAKEDLKVGMLVETEFGMSLVMNYKYGKVLLYRSRAFTKWGNVESCGIKKVWDICEDPVYVFDFSGCGRNVIYDRTQTKEMTVEEVSKALGYDVKIVKG